MLDLSFAAQSSALDAQVPTSTLGNAVWRTSSAPARCDADTAMIDKKTAKLVRIIVSPRFQHALSRLRWRGAAGRIHRRDCACRRPHRKSERRIRVSVSTSRSNGELPKKTALDRSEPKFSTSP